MARLPRYVLPGQPQHVIQRGNNRGVTFFAGEDYSFYRECLKEACDKHGCAVHAYVLMTNHVHLVLTPEAPSSIAKVMQSVGRRYVQYVNYTYRRTGTLWEGRYKATLIDSEQYLLTCSRYIELNPVRAGIVAHPGDYPWSSYRAHAHGQLDTLIQDHTLYSALGNTDSGRQEAYRALFKAQLDAATLNLIRESTIRESTNKAWALGSDRFREEIEAALQRRTRPLPRGGARRRTTESETSELL
jgi:putative transposase